MGNDEVKHHADYSDFKGGSSGAKKDILEQIIDSYEALSYEQTNWVCNLANCSSLLWHAFNEGLSRKVNWAGFYLLDPKDSSQLILGPFMGKVACQTIQIGKGVCGTAAQTLETQLVPDVNKYPGHIACDGGTNSEIVVPISVDGKLIGVLDIDCLELEGFDQIDQQYLEKLVESISKTCSF